MLFRSIDILIGTHKIIGKSVRFNDLGLLVVDEEQKFGVAVKEKLKQMKTNVDTLTMSATPIPRTLQFSLMGARDLSAITTPPANRYPIATTVCALTDVEEKIDNIQHEITVLEQKRDKLLDYNMGGYISDAEFLSRNKVFTQNIAEKKANLEQLKSMKPLSTKRART